MPIIAPTTEESHEKAHSTARAPLPEVRAQASRNCLHNL